MTELVTGMVDYYHRRAEIYDGSMGYDSESVVTQLAPVVASLRNQRAGRWVLEIACGPGFWTVQVSPSVERILATDINASTLSQARRKPLDWERVSLELADAYDLGPLSGSFNAALGVDWFAHVPRNRIETFLHGLHGKLKPGSRICFCDQTPGDKSISGNYDEQGNHIQTRRLPDGSVFPVIKNYYDADELAALAGRYGSDVTIEQFSECRRILVGYTL